MPLPPGRDALAVYGGTSWWELDGSPKIKATSGGKEVRREFLIFEEDDPPTGNAVNTFINELFPVVSVASGTLPLTGRYPILGAYLFANECDVEPYNKSIEIVDGIQLSEVYKATVVYKPVKIDPQQIDDYNPSDPDRFIAIERRENTTIEDMAMDGAGIFWEGTDERVADEAKATRHITIKEYEITRKRLKRSDIPRATIALVRGKVNESDFSSTHKLFPGVKAQCLLFTGESIADAPGPNGEDCVDLTYSFRERCIEFGGTYYGWNGFYRAGTNSMVNVNRRSNSEGGANAATRLYHETTNTNFDKLFPKAGD